MSDRPYVLLKCAMSLDGYLDDTTDQRLLLSSPEDFARVDEQRALVDAILIGATTLRKDNPRLMVRSPVLRQRRLDDGLTETPVKVTISRTGDLDAALPFFATGDCEKIVYVADSALAKTTERLGTAATVVAAGEPISLPQLLNDVSLRGVRSLMVEGGGTIHTQFLTLGLADELQVSVAPFFVGDGAAPPFVNDGIFPYNATQRMHLVEIGKYGDCALLRYALSDRFGELV